MPITSHTSATFGRWCCAGAMALLVLTSCGPARHTAVGSGSVTGGSTRPSQGLGAGSAGSYEARRRLLLEQNAALVTAERRIAEAKTPAEKLAAFDDFRRTQREQGRYPWGLDPVRERVTWSQALAWWPYDPVLRAGSLPGSPGTERVFSGSPDGGRHGDPHEDLTTLAVVYDFAPKSADDASYDAILDNGGIFVQVVYLPPAVAAQKTAPSDLAQPITVRGHAAMLSERARPKDNVDWRDITWNQPVRGGGVLAWTVSNSTAKYDRQESVAFVNRLIDVRGTG